jgi:hypothetical protein
MPGLFCLTIFSAPRIRSWTVSFSNSSVFSMSMSIADRPKASITSWYAPASASGDSQFGPSLLPLHPPNDGTMSPPAARISSIAAWSAPPVSGREPSHAGEQPPSDRTKAMVNDLTPVASITAEGEGGSPQPRNRYGAAGDTATGAAEAAGRNDRLAATAMAPASKDFIGFPDLSVNRTGPSVV